MSETRPKPKQNIAVQQSGTGVDRQLVLVKNGHRYAFQCAPGDEPRLLNRLEEMVRDPNTDLDWFDAAMVSHQIGRRLGPHLQQMRKTGTD